MSLFAGYDRGQEILVKYECMRCCTTWDVWVIVRTENYASPRPAKQVYCPGCDDFGAIVPSSVGDSLA